MEKMRSLVISVLGLACLLLITCRTAGTPKEPDDVAGGSPAPAGSQTSPRAVSAVPGRTVSYSATPRSVARVSDWAPVVAPARSGTRPSAQPRDLTDKAVEMTGNLSSASVREKEPMRAILYTAAAVILVGMLGAITTGLDRRHRGLAAPQPR